MIVKIKLTLKNLKKTLNVKPGTARKTALII